VLLTLLIKPLLAPTITPLFFAAVTVSVWYGGMETGLLATVLSALSINYFFTEPIYKLSVATLGELVRLSVFVLVTLLISSLNSELRTAKQRIEKSMLKLQASEKRYRHIVDTAYEGIWKFDAEAKAEYVNQRMAQMLGYSVEEMLGHPIFDFMEREAQIESQQLLQRRQQGIQEQFDFCFRRRDGSKLWAIVSSSPIVNEQGEYLGAIAMVTDVTARKQAEEALQASEERYRELFENANDVVYTLDLAGNLTSLNKAGERIIGYTREQLLNQPIAKLVMPEYLETMIQMFDRKLAGEKITTYELEIITKDNRLLTLEVNSRLIYKEGKPIGAQGIARDISDRKQVEQALRESESRLRSLVDSNLIGIIFATFSGNIIEANNEWLRILGYTQEEVLSGKVNFLDITPPEYQQLDQQAMEEMKRTGTHTPFEKEYIRKDGSRVPVLVGTAYLGGDNDLGVGFMLDLTERKQAEENLRQLSNQVQEQANTLNAILSASVDHIYIVDRVGRYKYVSAGGAEAVGLKPIDFVGKTWRDLGLPADTMQAFDAQREKVISTGEPLTTETSFSTPIGLRYYEYIVAPFYQERNIEGIVVISRDTTDRKQAEKAMRESEVRFRTLVEQSPLSMQIVSPDGLTLQVNRAWEELWGLTLDDLPEYNLLEDEQLVAKGIMPYIKQGFAGEAAMIPAIAYDPNESLPDRSIHQEPQRWVRGFIYPVKDEDENIREMVLIHEDITPRIRAEEAVRFSEAKFRRLAESNIIGVITVDIGGSMIEANDAFLQMIGYTQEELAAGNIDWQDLTPAEHLPQDRVAIEQLKQTGVCTPFEKEYIRKDGSRVPVFLGGALLEGSQSTTICFVLDLSDRKQAEKALKESEERFRLLAEKVRVIPWEADPITGRFTYVGPQAVEILGYPVEDWYSDNFWFQHIHPQDRDWAINYCLDCSATLDNYEFEYRMLTSDGRIVWLYDIVNVVRGENQPQLLRGLMIDINERKQAEEALQETNHTLQALIQACPLGITVYNFDGEVKLWNPAAERIFGWSEQEALGHFLPTVPEDKRDEFLFSLNSVRQGQALTGVEGRRQRKDGLPIDVALWAAPLRDAKDNTSCMSIIADISERKQLEEERAQLLASEQAARADAEAANRMKDEFLATLSHELRTPLNSMLGWTQLLRTRKFDQKTADRALETIDRNTKSLAQLIEDVLDVSRIITGKLRLNVRPVELVPAIEAAIDTLQPAAEAKKIRLESVLDRSTGKILGDSNRLQQVVWNLLSNAVKFTPKGGRVEVQLLEVKSIENSQLTQNSVRAGLADESGFLTEQSLNITPPTTQNSYVQIRVSDTGKGIPANFLPYVFERFRQADGSITRTYGGLGLGLAIVRYLVELHGGTVHALSEGEGQGATFVVNLPLIEKSRGRIEAGVQGEKITEETSLASSASPASQAQETPLSGLRVLVVDDEADTRELLITILEQYGAEVTASASASEALEALQRFKPNVLVSDIGMPEVDGYTLIRKIRTLDADQGGQIPAVALTAYARAEERNQALLAGFQLHVPKPVDPAELAIVVANLAGKW
jgi:PAS domain S-box-containing protein